MLKAEIEQVNKIAAEIAKEIVKDEIEKAISNCKAERAAISKAEETPKKGGKE